MRTKVEYDDRTIAFTEGGKIELHCEGKKMNSDVVITVEGDAQPEGGGGGGAPTINGIIKQFKVNAGANVSAGDFVEFVNKFNNGIFSEGAVNVNGVCKLDNSRVFIAYDGYAVIVTINSMGVTVGNAVAISGRKFVALSDNKVLCVYWDEDGCYALVATIDGEQITVSEATKVFTLSGESSGGNLDVIALTDNESLMVGEYIYKSGSIGCYAGFAIVISVDGDSITYGTRVSITENANYTTSGASFVRAIKLIENKAIFLRGFSSEIISYVLTINNKTITVGERCSTRVGSRLFAATAVSENYALVLFSSSSSSNNLKAIYIKEADSKVTFSSSVSIVSDTIINNASIVALSNNKALVIYGRSSYGYAQVLSIDTSSSSISVGVEKIFDYNTVTSTAVIAFSPNSALVVYNNATGAFASLSIDDDTITTDSAEIGTFVQPATSSLQNVGVAKTSGNEGDTVDVYCVN